MKQQYNKCCDPVQQMIQYNSTKVSQVLVYMFGTGKKGSTANENTYKKLKRRKRKDKELYY